jgi:hypothetical protein
MSTNLANTASILRPDGMDDNGETVPHLGKVRQYPRTLTGSEAILPWWRRLETAGPTPVLRALSTPEETGLPDLLLPYSRMEHKLLIKIRLVFTNPEGRARFLAKISARSVCPDPESGKARRTRFPTLPIAS